MGAEVAKVAKKIIGSREKMVETIVDVRDSRNLWRPGKIMGIAVNGKDV